MCLLNSVFNFKLFIMKNKAFVNFKNLISKDKSLSIELGNLFGRQGTGFVVVKDIPNFPQARENLLKKGYELLNQPKESLDHLRSKSEKYYVGYSDTPFVTDDGAKHKMMNSFVARSISDTCKSDVHKDFEEGFKNIWPSEKFKESFTSVGKIISECQHNLFRHLCVYIDNHIQGFYEKNHNEAINQIDVVSRLINYFPPENFASYMNNRTWDGWHTDYGYITAITHPMFFNKKAERTKIQFTCLQVMDRAGNSHEVKIEENDLLLITSNASLIFSGGLIPATPHVVKLEEEMPLNLSRVTMATFFQPNPDYIMNIPNGKSFEEIHKGTHYMNEYFENGITYQSYSDKLLDFLISRKNEKKNI